MAPQDPPPNPSPAPAPVDSPPATQPAPPSYSHHDPNQMPRPEATYQQHPQPGYAQQPTYVTTLGRLNDQPELVDCPFCQHQAMTRVAKEDSSMTMVAGGLLCLVCICLTCLPCMLGWCQNVDHYCSKCGKQLTHKPHDGTVQITEAAREAQNRLGLAGPQQRGPAPGQVPSQYGMPPMQQQQHTGMSEYGSAQPMQQQPTGMSVGSAPGNEYGSQQQQQQPQQLSSEIPIQEAPQSPPPAQVHNEKS